MTACITDTTMATMQQAIACHVASARMNRVTEQGGYHSGGPTTAGALVAHAPHAAVLEGGLGAPGATGV